MNTKKTKYLVRQQSDIKIYVYLYALKKSGFHVIIY
jgi:hypothetical protein